MVTSTLSGDKLTVEFENTISGYQKNEYTLNKEVDEVINTVALKVRTSIGRANCSLSHCQVNFVNSSLEKA